MITTLFQLLILLIRLYIWAVILAAVFSMLAAFNILDTRNRLVFGIGDFLHRVTEPGLRPIRNLLPRFSAIDISPMILILLLQYVALPIVGRLYEALLQGSWQPLIS